MKYEVYLKKNERNTLIFVLSVSCTNTLKCVKCLVDSRLVLCLIIIHFSLILQFQSLSALKMILIQDYNNKVFWCVQFSVVLCIILMAVDFLFLDFMLYINTPSPHYHIHIMENFRSIWKINATNTNDTVASKLTNKDQ